MATTTKNGKVTIAHDDHGLTKEHVSFVEQVAMKHEGLGCFFVANEEMPAELPDLTSGLYGPSVGDAPITEDEVSYEIRNGRPGPSRLIKRPARSCRRMVVIGLDKGEEGIVIFTAYGTQSTRVSPREWWDASMKPHEAIEAAKFWAEHALAL